jgi:hypothetical protein
METFGALCQVGRRQSVIHRKDEIMKREEAAEIVYGFIANQENLLPCHIESICFFGREANDLVSRAHWAAVIAFDS